MTEDRPERGAFTASLEKALEVDTNRNLDTQDRILIAIGHELHEIKHELSLLRQALTITVQPDTGPVFKCKGCGKTLSTEDAAKRHAHADHGAPRDDKTWRNLYHEHRTK